MRLGSGQFVYEEVDGWGEVPDGWNIVEVPGVAVDSEDRVYVFCRSEHPVIVFDRDGRFLRSWGEGLIKRPHDIIVGPDDSIYCVDDWGHAVHKYNTEGELLMSIETADNPSDTGYIWDVQKNVLRAGPPFNYPTGIALSPEGELYVSDGYGNARVHKFTADGELLLSWGEPGRRRRSVRYTAQRLRGQRGHSVCGRPAEPPHSALQPGGRVCRPVG